VTAAQLIAGLGLAPHPEGGWYRELFRSAHRVQSGVRERSALTTIYYLLEADQVSRWHVVDSDESWHFHAGAALELSVYSPATRELVAYRLDSAAPTAQPVAVVPALAWQAARSTGDYSLVSCCVGPGFEFGDFRFVVEVEGYQAHFDGPLRDLRGLL
jgi:predicted cupin superfamily sugar epimerase